MKISVLQLSRIPGAGKILSVTRADEAGRLRSRETEKPKRKGEQRAILLLLGEAGR